MEFRRFDLFFKATSDCLKVIVQYIFLLHCRWRGGSGVGGPENYRLYNVGTIVVADPSLQHSNMQMSGSYNGSS